LEIQPKRPTVKGPAESFTGDVSYDVIAEGVPPSRLRVSIVPFSPGAQTAWHRHANGQTLHVTEGRGLVQARGADVVEVRPGDTRQRNGTGMARHLSTSCPIFRCRRIWPRVKRAQSQSGAST
jgi:Cupin domain